MPILAILLWIGGPLLKIGNIGIGLIAMHEFYGAFTKERSGLHTIGYAFALLYGVFIEKITYGNQYFSVFVSAFMVVLLIYTVMNHKKATALDGMTTFFGFFYCFFLLNHIYLVREFAYGRELIWLAFITAFGCDTGAYFVGVSIGKHKLIPDLSPNKTIEGSLGGIAFATVLSIAFGTILDHFIVFEGVNLMLLCGLVGLVGSLLAQIGDLSASAMKRLSGVKDFGKLIPGHGGIIDRFDSVILTTPALYYLMIWLIETH